MRQFQSEQSMEDTLINQLTSGTSQWTYRDDLRTEEALWANVKQKIEQNNVECLDDTMLTEQEFNQIKDQLHFANFYEAAQFWAGENGVSKVTVQREDVKLGTVHLEVHRASDITGGTSSYEVINQCVRFKEHKLDRNRRFDVTLLLNGLPIIHIELKNRANSYMDGFKQIKKYAHENAFRGIFSTLQMFVVSNGSGTRYIAPTRTSDLNATFLTKWVDTNNKPVEDYLAFAKEVLSIPMAHKMITDYTVMDAEQTRIMILRPYQIHAIEAVKHAMKAGKSGHVWHTTGSGKTLTSYKVARNLLRIPKLDKSVFIVDRKDLDQQTSKWFKAYSANDVIDVDETDNVNKLIEALLSPKRTVLVTTVQKIQHLIKRLERDTATVKQQATKQRLRELSLSFVVDECHRAVTAETQQIIGHFFGQALWYGFTGTPIFTENKKDTKGDLPSTTEGQYGPCLHEYTVKEAINDKTVLGFQVEYKHTLNEDEIDDALVNYGGVEEDELSGMDKLDKELNLPDDVYRQEDHMLNVVESIVNKSRHKLGLKNGVGQTFSGILTTSSISQAIRYYDLFRQLETDESKVKISEKVKKSVVDFPRVAITYSIQENETVSVKHAEAMKVALEDYNKRFGTAYALDTISAYNHNLNERLARSNKQYHHRHEQLDLVIVVDRLLTGFDAPYVSTLFVDRKPMQPHDIIQAFSRTNRILNDKKRYGQIVTFQYPESFNVAVQKAIGLYSGGGESFVLAPPFNEWFKQFKAAHKRLVNLAPEPEDALQLSKIQKEQFLNAFQAFDRAHANIVVYGEFQELIDANENYLEDTFNLSKERFERYVGVYKNIFAELRQEDDDDEGGDGSIPQYDVEYELESRQTDEIDYKYILRLIQSVVPENDDEDGEAMNDKDREEVESFIETLGQTNKPLANMVRWLWHEVERDPNRHRGRDTSVLLEEQIQQKTQSFIMEMARNWNADPDDIAYVLHHYQPDSDRQVGEQELRRRIRQNYDKNHNYPVDADIKAPKLNVPKQAIEDIYRTINDEVLPLLRK